MRGTRDTPTVILTYMPGAKKSVGIDYIVIAKRYDSAAVEADTYYYNMHFLITTASSGAVTVRASSTPEGLKTGSTTLYEISGAANGNDFEMKVAGVAGGGPESVRWFAVAHIQQIEMTIAT